MQHPTPRAPVACRLILWGLRVAIVVSSSAGTWATLSEGNLQATDWRDLIVYGIAQGSVYALIALGYTLVYGVLFMINFAHGDVFMSGAMTGLLRGRLASPTAGFIDATRSSAWRSSSPSRC